MNINFKEGIFGSAPKGCKVDCTRTFKKPPPNREKGIGYYRLDREYNWNTEHFSGTVDYLLFKSTWMPVELFFKNPVGRATLKVKHFYGVVGADPDRELRKKKARTVARKEAKRDKIISVAAKAFEVHGFKKVTYTMLNKELGYPATSQLIKNLFVSKERLYAIALSKGNKDV